MEAPIVSTQLQDVDLPESVLNGLVTGLRCKTVRDVVNWVDKPDKEGRRGLEKFRALSYVGDKKLARIDDAFVSIGVDLTR